LTANDAGSAAAANALEPPIKRDVVGMSLVGGLHFITSSACRISGMNGRG
jgi:hypothetical protein